MGASLSVFLVRTAFMQLYRSINYSQEFTRKKFISISLQRRYVNANAIFSSSYRTHIYIYIYMKFRSGQKIMLWIISEINYCEKYTIVLSSKNLGQIFKFSGLWQRVPNLCFYLLFSSYFTIVPNFRFCEFNHIDISNCWMHLIFLSWEKEHLTTNFSFSISIPFQSLELGKIISSWNQRNQICKCLRCGNSINEN